MTYQNFEMYAKEFNMVPVYKTITADLLTPVSAFLKLREKNKYCFLLESVEGIGKMARYSFIVIDAVETIKNRNMDLTINNNPPFNLSIFDYLDEKVKSKKSPSIEGLPDFTGGIVGYIGYENISLIEEVIKFNQKDELEVPDSILAEFRTLVCFDHFKHQIILIHNAEIGSGNLEELYNDAIAKLNSLKKNLQNNLDYKTDFKSTPNQFTKEQKDSFIQNVEQSKKFIYQGEVFQIVPSQRFNANYNGDLFNVYRALRIINPSPYMYYMQFGNELTIIGTSPEDLIKVKNGKADILPIAGTRRRGKNEEEDKKLSEELISDPKEISEHVMLVDLARNDLGRVCSYGSINVIEDMKINYFSHVMHIVSRVQGTLAANKNCIDAFKASFPAGTVTGAPKIRAMQLISNYEKVKRGIYSGAIGYIDFKGNMDMCIAIRTLFANSKNIYWQAGAGVVADSIPEMELKEIQNKAAVLESALKYAEVIDEHYNN